ncbi:MAG: FliH/SctL family protein [Anaerolineae bacterium]
MSRILKTIVFEADRSVTIETERTKAASTVEVIACESPPALEPELTLSEAEGGDNNPLTLVTEAQTHVELMLKQAQLQVNTWEEEARQQGWQAGYSEAHQAIEKELAEALTTVQHLAESAAQAYEQFLRDNQAEVGRLAVAIAEKIIGKELSLNPKVVTDIIAQAIKAANIRGACRILVNSQDYEIIEPFWAAIPSLQPPGHAWELLPDSRVSRGGCIIEAGGGTIDAQLETQLEQVATALQL